MNKSKKLKWFLPFAFLAPLVAMFTVSCSSTKETPNKGLNVLWIGIDGFSANVWKKHKTPNIEKLISKSNWTMDAQDIMPSKTYPNWTALLTSQKPDKTGIKKNPGSVIFSKVVKTPTKQNNYGKGVAYSIYDALKSQTKLRTMFTYGLSSQFNLKEIINPNSVDTMLFATRDNNETLDSNIKKQINSNHKGFAEAFKVQVGYLASQITDEEVIKQNTDAIIKNKTDFAFGHIAGLDIRGHEFNWGSDIYIDYMNKIDTYIGQAIQKLKDANTLKNTMIIITSDHGGVIGKNSHGNDTPDERTVPVIIFDGRKQKEKHLKNVSNLDVTPTLAKQYHLKQYFEWEGKILNI